MFTLGSSCTEWHTHGLAHRTNIGNAKVDGLVGDLNMTDGQYTASLSIFFVSYSVFEPLTNVLLKRLRPSVFLPLIMVLWGVIMVRLADVSESCCGD